MSGAEDFPFLVPPPIETPGLKMPEFKTEHGDYYNKSIKKGDFWIIRHDEGPDGRKLPLLWNIEEKLGPTLNSGQLDGGVKEHPWDTVVLMTTKWLIVARPEPQSEHEKVEAQAAAIWKEALRKIGADNSQTIAICWILIPDSAVIPNQKLNLLPTSERVRLYKKKMDEGMSAVPWIKRSFCRIKNYTLEDSWDPTSEIERSRIWRNRIVIHDKDTYSGLSNIRSNNGSRPASSIIPDADYLDLGFLPITMGWDHVKIHVAREPLKCFDNTEGAAGQPEAAKEATHLHRRKA